MLYRQSECKWELCVFVDDEGKPYARGARYWGEDTDKHPYLKKFGALISDPWFPYPYDRASAFTNETAAYSQWELNYQACGNNIIESCDKVEPSDIVYIVASGPSLLDNMEYLKYVRHGKVVGINTAPKLGVKCDYFATMDWSLLPENCFNGDEQMTGVFSTQTSWRIPASNVFTRRLWGIPMLPLPLFNKQREEHPNLVGITCQPGSGGMALEWAARFLKPKVIVLVGFDMCAKLIGDNKMRIHANGKDDMSYPKEWEKHICKDITGKDVMRADMYQRMSNYFVPLLWFFIDHGIKVINATEGGLLFENCERMRLSSAIALCNLFGDTGDERVLPVQRTTVGPESVEKKCFGNLNDWWFRQLTKEEYEKAIKDSVIPCPA